MAYFPFFVDLSGKVGLIVGGGIVALRKIEKLMPFGPILTVAAPKFLPEVETCSGLILLQQPFAAELLDGKAFVIAATDDAAVNREIAALCRERNIPVNVVDDPDACTFLFPALVKQGDLTVGISTGGASPSAAVWVKEQVEEFLPERMDEILAYLGELRRRIKDLPAERMRLFKAAFDVCMELGRPLTDEELETLIKEGRCG